MRVVGYETGRGRVRQWKGHARMVSEGRWEQVYFTIVQQQSLWMDECRNLRPVVSFHRKPYCSGYILDREAI